MSYLTKRLAPPSYPPNPFGTEDREIVTKQMIHSWNVASTRFDIVCNFLAELYEKKVGSGNYHLKSNGLGFNVFDLVDNELLLPSHIFFEPIDLWFDS